MKYYINIYINHMKCFIGKHIGYKILDYELLPSGHFLHSELEVTAHRFTNDIPN
jgi:hypothetical protein